MIPKGDPVTEEFLRDFVDRWAAAWNSLDTDTVMSLMHPDIVWEDLVFWPRVIHGHEELREYAARRIGAQVREAPGPEVANRRAGA